VYHLPLPSREDVYVRYPLEDDEGGALLAAHRRYRDILAQQPKSLPADVQRDISEMVPGVLPQTLAADLERDEP
jgi:hypothetical protein